MTISGRNMWGKNRGSYRSGTNKIKKESFVKEDFRTDLEKFMQDVDKMQTELNTMPKSHTALIESQSLTNFLLWKLLTGTSF